MLAIQVRRHSGLVAAVLLGLSGCEETVPVADTAVPLPAPIAFSYTPGDPITEVVLQGLERYYGGLRHVEADTLGCPLGCQGGDKFSYHKYGAEYARHFDPLKDKRITIVEVGVLEGTSLAVWSDIFPKGRVVGFDISLDAYNKRLPMLRELGAFKNKNVEVHQLDSTLPATQEAIKQLIPEKIDLFVDDGCHTTDCITATWANVLPSMKAGGVGLLEDNVLVHQTLRFKYPGLEVVGPLAGELTVVRVPNSR